MRKYEPRNLRATEVVRVVDLSPIQMVSGDDVRLRVEIHRDLSVKRRFTAKVWRLEFYRIRPTFPQTNGRPPKYPADEQILVVDANFAQQASGASADSVLAKVLIEIRNLFFPRARGPVQKTPD